MSELLATLNDVIAREQGPIEEKLPGRTVYEALMNAARIFGDQPAIHFLPTGSADDPVFTTTYAEFGRRVTQTANLFLDLGVGPTDTVTTLLPILAETHQVLFGAEAVARANPVNPFLEISQLTGIMNAAKTKVLVGCAPDLEPDVWGKIRRLRDDIPSLEKIVMITGPERCPVPDLPDDVLIYEDLIDDYDGEALSETRDFALTDVCALFHTGGTTGTPKLAQHTQLGQLAQCYATGEVTSPYAGEVILTGMPLFHIGGAMCFGLGPLSRGQTLVILSPQGMRNPNAVRDHWALVTRFRATILMGVPTVWSTLLNNPTKGYDLSTVKFAVTGGSTLPVVVGKAVQDELGIHIIEGYGMTEVHSYTTMNPPGGEMRIGSVGLRVPYTEFRIVEVDDSGNNSVRDCATGEIGLVIMRGPQNFAGYLDPVHNEHAFVDGDWVNSGDLGRFDKDGYLWLTGRAKDVIIRGGHNIDPQVIEDALYEHPDVELAAAVGRPDAYAGEIPVAYVQLKPGRSITGDELAAFARERIPERAANPAGVFVMPEVPVTGVGKIFKPAMRWDAAQRVFDQVLTPLKERGVGIEVSVGAHKVHGSLATVTADAPESERAAIEEEIKALLGPFPVRYELVWKD
jgi:fatty-acyl-CoA synthase